ncbi:NFATC2-interacting protein-like [Actinia tenebrosa]|uniref:NFATC2-interacting protein-like n=1 Tax=Actinia tenebrosa TaxID=6105 RepID=A0A6P8HQD6_ACTTE|nr:NFATC2-interacting protein-like [Actinia tenebrosa]
MASKEAKALTTEANQKADLSKKRKRSAPDLDLFSYDNQINLTFSYSTKSARIPITIDSSDEDDDDDDDVDEDGPQEFKRTIDDDDDILDDSFNDDSQEIQNIDSDDDSSVNKSINVSHKRSPSPPPPPPSQAELLRVQRQLKAKNTTREFEHAFDSLKEAVAADSSSPATPPVNRSTGVIILDDIDTPVLNRNSVDRKVDVKVRTSSGIKKFNMKAGDKFEFVINELAKSQNVPVENILLSLKDVNIMPDDTPLTKGVTVADIVECVIMDSCAAVEEEDYIEIKVQGNTVTSRKTFQVSKSQPLEKLFKEYSEFHQLPRSKLKFLFDGDSLTGSETPVDLDMEDENVIDVTEIS